LLDYGRSVHHGSAARRNHGSAPRVGAALTRNI